MFNFTIKKLASIVLVSHSFYAVALPIIPTLKTHYPERYVVKKGDTIYDIAGKFLNKPWEWKKIWHDNPQIKNPKKLYPGTVLVLKFYEGQPHLSVNRHGTYKLSPQIRIRPAQKAIPPINLSDIKPFLNRSRIFDIDELSSAGYVVAYKGAHLLGSQDEQIYVSNLQQAPKSGLSYAIYRPGGIYKNPNFPKLGLGYKATFIGDAQLIAPGAPATLELTQITQGVKIKDRVLLNNKADFDLSFEPKAPSINTSGNVVETLSDYDHVATNQIVVIDKGKVNQLEAGDVLILWQKPRLIQDPMDKEKLITLPKEKLGEAMIFKTFTYASYALIVNSTRSIKAGDDYTSP